MYPASMTRKTDGLEVFESAFAERISTVALGRTSTFERTVSSTNDVARQWAEQGTAGSPRTAALHGALVFAEYQSRGRGRQGREWASMSGLNLTFSLVLRPELPVSQYPMLTLAAGKSVQLVVKRHNPALRVSIKWPNDILVNGSKCAGILLESSIGRRKYDNVVILGIGINVNQATFSADIEDTATSLLLESGLLQDRVGILVEVLAELETQINILSVDPEGFVNSYERAMEGMGKSVQLNTFVPHSRRSDADATSDVDPSLSSIVAGTISGVTEDGALRLETESGERILYAGEVTFRDH